VRGDQKLVAGSVEGRDEWQRCKREPGNEEYETPPACVVVATTSPQAKKGLQEAREGQRRRAKHERRWIPR
jgi:hypothetical protein